MNPQADAQPHEVKPVLLRFPSAMHERVKLHQAQMSATMGGARVSFQQAALHLMQAGADAHDVPANT